MADSVRIYSDQLTLVSNINQPIQFSVAYLKICPDPKTAQVFSYLAEEVIQIVGQYRRFDIEFMNSPEKPIHLLLKGYVELCLCVFSRLSFRLIS